MDKRRDIKELEITLRLLSERKKRVTPVSFFDLYEDISPFDRDMFCSYCNKEIQAILYIEKDYPYIENTKDYVHRFCDIPCKEAYIKDNRLCRCHRCKKHQHINLFPLVQSLNEKSHLCYLCALDHCKWTIQSTTLFRKCQICSNTVGFNFPCDIETIPVICDSCTHPDKTFISTAKLHKRKIKRSFNRAIVDAVLSSHNEKEEESKSLINDPIFGNNRRVFLKDPFAKERNDSI